MAEQFQSRSVEMPPIGGRRESVLAAASPGQWIALLLLVFGAAWLAHLSYTSLSPPTDNIEQLT